MRNLPTTLAIAGMVVVVMTMQLSTEPAAASSHVDLWEPDARTGAVRYVIGFDESVDAATAIGMATEHDLEPDRWIEGIHALVVLADSSDLAGASVAESAPNLEGMAARPGVAYVEPDVAVDIQAAPDDPLFATGQWAPQRINAVAAWDVTMGSDEVVVAVVDTGVDPEHPDLTGKLVPGTDIYNRDTDPSDDNGHGTLLAGIIGARTNNGVGMAGVGYETRIMPVKVANEAGSSSYSRISEGVVWAVDNGANVVNISLGATFDLENLRNAMAYAENAGVVVVASSGNHAADTPFYPAAYDSVIGVGATDASDGQWVSGGYGTWLDLTAPGVSILTTNWTGNGGSEYEAGTGTSFAAPHVAAVAALMLSVDASFAPYELRTALEDSAVDLGEMGFDQLYGHGRLDAEAAVLSVRDCVPTSVLLLSLDGTGSVGGVTYDEADVLAFDERDDAWSLFFDGSDLGLDKANLAAFTALPDGDMLLALEGKATIDGIDDVSAVDIVRFTPTQLGENTVGSFSLYFDGSDVGLHKRFGIDALALDMNGNLILSFKKAFGMGDLSGDGHDLVQFTPDTLGENTSGSWSLLLDGSEVGLGTQRENLDAVWFDTDTSEAHMSTDGDFEIDGLQGEGGDVFVCALDAGGDPAVCTFADGIDWSGSDHGLGAAGIDGLATITWRGVGPIGSPPCDE